MFLKRVSPVFLTTQLFLPEVLGFLMGDIERSGNGWSGEDVDDEAAGGDDEAGGGDCKAGGGDGKAGGGGGVVVAGGGDGVLVRSRNGEGILWIGEGVLESLSLA